MSSVVVCEDSVHGGNPGIDCGVVGDNATEVRDHGLVLRVIVEDKQRKSRIALDVADGHLATSKEGLGALTVKALLELAAEVSELLADRLLLVFFNGCAHVRTGWVARPPVIMCFNGPVGMVALHRRASVETVLDAKEVENGIGLVESNVAHFHNWQLTRRPLARSFGSTVLFERQTIVFKLNLCVVKNQANALCTTADSEVKKLHLFVTHLLNIK